MFDRKLFLRRRGLAALIATGLLIGTATASAGVIFDHAPNLIGVQTTVVGGFDGTGSVSGVDTMEDTDFGNVVDTMLVSTVTSGVALAPASGGGTAQGDLKVTFEHGITFPGATLADDLLRIEMSGVASASSALNSAGNEADARVDGKANLQFYLDPLFGGAPAGSPVGAIVIDALRPLDPYETLLALEVRENGTPVASLSAGSAATSVTLLSGSAYAISFNYSMDVPFGVDPPFSFVLDMPIRSLVTVPAPASVLMAGLGLLAVASGRRARRRGTS